MDEQGYGAFGKRTRQEVILVQKRNSEAWVWSCSQQRMDLRDFSTGEQILLETSWKQQKEEEAADSDSEAQILGDWVDADDMN